MTCWLAVCLWLCQYSALSVVECWHVVVMADSVCCLCDMCISNSKGKNRYKLLHGTSAAALRKLLTVCILAQFSANLDTFGLDKPSRVLCYGCSLTLEKIGKKCNFLRWKSWNIFTVILVSFLQLNIAHQIISHKEAKYLHVSTTVNNPRPCTPIYITFESNRCSTPGRPQPQGRQSSTLISALRDSEGINPSISEDTQQETRSTKCIQ